MTVTDLSGDVGAGWPRTHAVALGSAKPDGAAAPALIDAKGAVVVAVRLHAIVLPILELAV